MDLGVFSVSLAVKDIAASRAFYEALGFSVMGGDASQGWLILTSKSAVIGLFQGMFEANILTFTPGWGADGQNVDPFTDVREIAARLEGAGLAPVWGAEPPEAGPAHLTLTDPDGNTILIDQHR